MRDHSSSATTSCAVLLRAVCAALALMFLCAGTSRADSLEAETRRPAGTNSLEDDSERLRGSGTADSATDGLDDDSMQLRRRTADQDGTNSLDNGSLDSGDRPGAD